MSLYQWESRYLSQPMAENYLRELMEQNGEGNAFVDVYYPYLEEESKQQVREVLDPEDGAYLDSLTDSGEGVIVPLNERLLRIATILNEKEMLFFTFYFTGIPCTIWGNYKQEYLCFREKKQETEERQ